MVETIGIKLGCCWTTVAISLEAINMDILPAVAIGPLLLLLEGEVTKMTLDLYPWVSLLLGIPKDCRTTCNSKNISPYHKVILHTWFFSSIICSISTCSSLLWTSTVWSRSSIQAIISRMLKINFNGFIIWLLFLLVKIPVPSSSPWDSSRDTWILGRLSRCPRA